MICKRCGAKIEKGNFFCSKCGRSLGTVSEVEELMKADSGRKRNRNIVIAIAVLVMCGVGYSAINAFHGGDNSMVIESSPTTVPESTAKTVLSEPTPQPVDEMPAITETDLPSETNTENQPINDVSIESTAVLDDTYIYPSDTQLFTEEFLSTLNRKQARLARNELYARHGLVFGYEDLQSFFEGKSWYVPDPNAREYRIYKSFSEIEYKNHKMIVNYEKKKGWAY